MPKTHSERVECPGCGKVSQFSVIDSVTMPEDSELYERIMNGDMFTLTCPHCGFKGDYKNPLLYHQKDKYMIYFVPGDKSEAINTMKHAQKELDPQYKFRVVGTLNDLREKIMTLDDGLDDKVIQLMKLAVYLTLRKDEPELTLDHFLFVREKDSTEYFLLGVKHGGEQFTVKYDRGMYDAIEKDFSEILKTDNEYMITSGWAAMIMKKNLNK